MKPFHLRPATPTERQLAVLWGAAAVSAIILQPLWIAIAPHLRPCTFRNLTGIPCPTCGTTRTALALFDLDLRAALIVNPLATAAGVAFLVGGVLALVWALVRGPFPASNLRRSRWWISVILGAGLINWIYLILTD